jgi:hypothetical protein
VRATPADGASFLDLALSGEGRGGIDATAKAAHEKYSGHRFKADQRRQCTSRSGTVRLKPRT